MFFVIFQIGLLTDKRVFINKTSEVIEPLRFYLFSGILLSEMSQNLRGLNAPEILAVIFYLLGTFRCTILTYGVYCFLKNIDLISLQISTIGIIVKAIAIDIEKFLAERRKLKYVIESRYINNSYRQHERQYHCTY